MLILMALAPVMFNFRTFFRIGMYDVEDDFINTYSDGTGGIILHLHLQYEVNNRYAIGSWIELQSTEDVVNYGLNLLDVQYIIGNESKYDDSLIFGTPRDGYSIISIRLDLLQNENFTCKGVTEVALQADGLPKNETINFQLSFIVPLSRQDFINIDLAIYSLFFLYFFLYIIVPVVLVKLFKPVLGFKYKEEDEKKDEKFLSYISGQADIKRKEDKKN